MRIRRKKNKQYAIQQLGGKCIKCGEKEDLQFDHKDRKIKKQSIANMLAHSIEKLNKELEKCQLLCEPCHRIKTFQELGWQDSKKEHGTPRSHLYCKCDICRKAHRERIYAWRRKTGRH